MILFDFIFDIPLRFTIDSTQHGAQCNQKGVTDDGELRVSGGSNNVSYNGNNQLHTTFKSRPELPQRGSKGEDDVAKTGRCAVYKRAQRCSIYVSSSNVLCL